MDKKAIQNQEERAALTAPEQEIYTYISEVIRRDGYSPTVREICDTLQIRSTSTAHKYLTRLEEKGYISRKVKNTRSASHVMRLQSEEQPRSAALPEQKEPLCWIPLLGSIAAGQPIMAQESLETYVPFSVNTRQYDVSTLFALRIHGQSMIGVGIMDGDIIIVSASDTIEDGALAAVLVEDEATCKRFFREPDGGYRLQPENPEMKPIYVDECRILGKVIASYRTY